MRTDFVALLVGVILACSTARAEELWGFSDIEFDEAAGLAGTVTLSETSYSTSYYYELHLYVDAWEGQGRLPGQWCDVWVDAQPSLGCGFDFELRPGYEYKLDGEHSLTAYFNVYQLDPYCGSDCYLWDDVFGYSASEAPCGRYVSGAPIPCDIGYIISQWVWRAALMGRWLLWNSGTRRTTQATIRLLFKSQ
jgi:hypothetical protein